ncbi:hypothetical protein HPB49_005074 [Dermacentor silvarum]|uniref:Uncharacterized protein n=1 Tax=Dermacentor silvarum TaxID=543639 RepID=A0ACB8D2N2_DERSI|nr:hypothetical protein HPB49_005074 [Dermacentor silvarum]
MLPCEVSDVIARRSREDSEVYDKVKAALFRKYRLSTEDFPQRFRDARRGTPPEFAYHVNVNLVEWLKSAQAYGNHDKECMMLEQFFRGIAEEVRLWVQDRMMELDVERAAELAEDYCMRRNFRSTPRRSERSDKAGFGSGKPEGNKSFRRNFKPET